MGADLQRRVQLANARGDYDELRPSPHPPRGWLGGPRVLCETRSPSPYIIISLQKQRPSHLFSSVLSSYQRCFTSAHIALLPPSLSSLMSFLRLFATTFIPVSPVGLTQPVQHWLEWKGHVCPVYQCADGGGGGGLFLSNLAFSFSSLIPNQMDVRSIMQHFIVLMRKRWYGFALIFAVASANHFVFQAVFDGYVKNLRDKPSLRTERHK